MDGIVVVTLLTTARHPENEARQKLVVARHGLSTKATYTKHSPDKDNHLSSENRDPSIQLCEPDYEHSFHSHKLFWVPLVLENTTLY